MRKLLPILFLIAFASCGEKGVSEKYKSDNILEKLTYSVDTVVVDSGEELLVLGNEYIGNWSLSSDLSRIFTFSEKGNAIQEVDLDNLSVIGQYTFEKEGPDGTGDRVMGIQELDNHQFAFSTYFATYVFDRSGKKIKEYKLTSKEIEGIDLEDDFVLNNNAKIYGVGKNLYAIQQSSIESQLIKVDLNEMKADTLSLAKLSKTRNFATMFLKPGAMRFYSLSIQMQFLRDQVLLFSPVTNTIYVFNPNTNLIEEKSFAHKLVPLEKEWGDYPREANSLEEFNAIMAAVNAQIHFGRFFWDDTRKLYFRLSQKGKEIASPDQKMNHETFIHAYDENLHLVGEAKLDELQEKLYDQFFKDGKLWSYVNVEDELGFAVFTFDF
ncbi:DUF4221 family protein [Algoriphagus marinus]|uniref:DUF4221 family protein n=1 Tax=Algoriphagus marinus TaxID=1925762 RepID=UPI00094B822E|nr:DUF4221 family protein [Algoriphagus marinus]